MLLVTKGKHVGEMSPDQLWETTMNPNNRRLKQLTIEDAEKFMSALDVCMGDDVPPRKEFIINNAVFN